MFWEEGMKIGLVGVGKIGLEISKHLIAAGHEVSGYRRASMVEFEKAGGRPASSPAAVGEQADVVFSCLPGGGTALDEVVSGPQGLLRSARAGQLIVELGSHGVAAKERQIAPLAAKGAIFIDGEVSGTPGMVAARKAPIYLAGDADACQKLEPIVKTFADICLYLGSFGSATKIKLVNNLLVTVNTAVIGEAVAVALEVGVDPEMMLKAITNGSGGSVLFPIRATRMINNSYKPPQGKIGELCHYFELIDELAATAGIKTPLFRLSTELFRRGVEIGLAEHDVAAIIEVIRHLSTDQTGKSKARLTA
ncbi:MAG: NAD(P)-dependent oxidoreductase [Xanthobacteraceae bacterium]